MRKGNLIFAFVLEGIGILTIVESYELGLQTFSNPGPGLFPFLLGIILCILVFPSLINSLKDLSKSSIVEKEELPENQVNIKGLIAVIVYLIGYFLLFDTLGFVIATFLFLIALFWNGNLRKLVHAVILSAVVDFLAYLIFNILLQVQFPSGILNFG